MIREPSSSRVQVWPSYYQSWQPGAIHEKADYLLGAARTEIDCWRCDAHLGHVFDDGPRPKVLHCYINSGSLFVIGFAWVPHQLEISDSFEYGNKNIGDIKFVYEDGVEACLAVLQRKLN